MSPAVAAPLELSREQILAHRRSVGSLDERLPPGAASLRLAAWAGFTDSTPRAALLSIHARVEDTGPTAWEDPAFVQVWGPRFSAYVIAAEDLAVFTLGRMPDEKAGRDRAVNVANDLDQFLAGRTMTYSEAGHGMGIDPNMLRYGTATGRILIRWDGARRPTIRMVPAPDVDPLDARRELARRFFHVLGPGTAESFSEWAGIRLPRARRIVSELVDELTPARTPIGEAWILASDESSFREPVVAPSAVRLLPSGDAYTFLHGRDRELVVADPVRRAQLWTTRVWPGALLVDGEIAGVWRRDAANLTIEPWRRFSPAELAEIEAEATSLPLPDVAGRMRVTLKA